MNRLADLEKTINTTFKDKRLLQQAFIHRSFLNESSLKDLSSNERLEFLGDAVLELATSEYLYKKLPTQPEGELTSLRSSLVKTDTLATVANKLKLGAFLKMSKGEKAGGGQTNTSLLANTVEALIGAIYLDQGFSQAEKFLQKFLFPYLSKVLKHNLHHDFKSTLQETVQSSGQETPAYRIIRQSGPDHQKIFVVEVKVNGNPVGRGKGSSKQRAEQQAAQKALKKLEKPE